MSSRRGKPVEELEVVFQRHVARLREMGVTGQIAIIPSLFTDDDPPERKAQWSLFVCGKLISVKTCWSEVEDDVRSILSGKRTAIIERDRSE